MSQCVERSDRLEYPTSSCVSMESDRSKGKPPDFTNEPGPPHTQMKRPAKPTTDDEDWRCKNCYSRNTAEDLRCRASFCNVTKLLSTSWDSITALPLSAADMRKSWHKDHRTQSRRDSYVSFIVVDMSTGDPAEDSNLVTDVQNIERNIHKSANSKSEYCELMREKRSELQERRKRREMKQSGQMEMKSMDQRSLPSVPLGAPINQLSQSSSMMVEGQAYTPASVSSRADLSSQHVQTEITSLREVKTELSQSSSMMVEGQAYTPASVSSRADLSSQHVQTEITSLREVKTELSQKHSVMTDRQLYTPASVGSRTSQYQPSILPSIPPPTPAPFQWSSADLSSQHVQTGMTSQREVKKEKKEVKMEVRRQALIMLLEGVPGVPRVQPDVEVKLEVMEVKPELSQKHSVMTDRQLYTPASVGSRTSQYQPSILPSIPPRIWDSIPPALPLSAADMRKSWHKDIPQRIRDLQVRYLVEAMSTGDPAKDIKDLVTDAQNIERNIYESANSYDEYCTLRGEKSSELREKSRKSREMEMKSMDQRWIPSVPLGAPINKIKKMKKETKDEEEDSGPAAASSSVSEQKGFNPEEMHQFVKPTPEGLYQPRGSISTPEGLYQPKAFHEFMRESVIIGPSKKSNLEGMQGAEVYGSPLHMYPTTTQFDPPYVYAPGPYTPSYPYAPYPPPQYPPEQYPQPLYTRPRPWDKGEQIPQSELQKMDDIDTVRDKASDIPHEKSDWMFNPPSTPSINPYIQPQFQPQFYPLEPVKHPSITETPSPSEPPLINFNEMERQRAIDRYQRDIPYLNNIPVLPSSTFSSYSQANREQQQPRMSKHDQVSGLSSVPSPSVGTTSALPTLSGLFPSTSLNTSSLSSSEVSHLPRKRRKEAEIEESDILPFQDVPHEVITPNTYPSVSSMLSSSSTSQQSSHDSPEANSTNPIRANVSLFYTPPNGDEDSILNVLLLPKTVPLYKVINKRRDLIGAEIYIQKPSCILIPNKEYTLSTSPQDDSIKIKPDDAIFEVDESDDNYVSTFEVSLEGKCTHVTLLLSEINTSICPWKHSIKLSGLALRRERVQSLSPDDMLFSVRSSFISNVSDGTLNILLDKLLEKRVINDIEREESAGMQTRDVKARSVIDLVRKKGRAPCSIMIDILCGNDPFLSEDLGLKLPSVSDN